MLLSITHRTAYGYDPAAQRAGLRLKLYPGDLPGQTVRDWSVTVNGAAPAAKIVNGYGDAESVWLSHDPVEAVEVIATGLVETRDVAGVLRAPSVAARPSVFLRQTPLTTPDEAIRELAKSAIDGETGVNAAHALCSAVNDAIAYEPGATDGATTAAEALLLGKGVCQDYAHVLIAAARALGAAARYVAGYLFVEDGDEEFIPTTETHAWAEIWIDGLGWVGFDPSNGVCPTDRFVRLACGLDATDAAPVRGAVTGATDEVLTAEVRVAQTQAQAQGQSQQ